MSFLLECPHCGPRDVAEFHFQGEVTRRPGPSPTRRELSEYVYFRDNVAGVQREWWFHRSGCRAWFVAQRDTRTNAVHWTALPGEVPEDSQPNTPVAASGTGGEATLA